MQLRTKYLFFLLTILSVTSSLSAHQYLPTQSAHAIITSVSTQDQNKAVAAIVTAQKANLRDRPSRSGSVVATVNHGDLLALVEATRIGPWYRVRDGKSGSFGWVHGNTIALLHTGEEAAAPTNSARPRRTAPPTTGRSYINVDGARVPAPVVSETKPTGATARCRDGAYSFSQHRRGTCSYHGGVAEWY